MTQLATARLTPLQLAPSFQNRNSLPMGTGAILYLGALVCENATGFLVRGAVSTTLKAVGILAPQPGQVPSNQITNSGADGAKSAEIYYQPVAKLNNDANDPVTAADKETACYILDDNTVSRTSGGTKSPAGKVVQVDDATSPTGAGVWVAIGQLPYNAAGSAGAQGATGAQGAQGPQGATGAQGPQGA